MRWMFEAKHATRMRPVRTGISCRNASPTSALGAGHAGPLRVRRVAEHQVDAAVAERGELADVGLEPVDRRVVELPVARVEARGRPAVSIDDRDAVRDRVRHADELELERADLRCRLAVRVGLAQLGRARSPCSSSFDLTIASVSLVPTPRRLDLAQHVRQRADVILVAVREDEREHLAVLEVGEVRQDEVDAEVLVAREREPGVDEDALRRRTRRRSCSCRPRRARRAG